MKKINSREISKSLSEKELKNVMGGMNLAGRRLSDNVIDERCLGAPCYSGGKCIVCYAKW